MITIKQADDVSTYLSHSFSVCQLYEILFDGQIVMGSATALTLGRLRGSGFRAVVIVAKQIMLGNPEVVIACGSENMNCAGQMINTAGLESKWGKAWQFI